MSRLVPFKPDHLDIFDMRSHEAGNMDVAYLLGVPNAFSLICAGRIVAVIGYYELWKGVLDVFVVPSIHVPQHKKSLVKLVRGALNRLWTDLGLHRIQTSSLADEETDRWMRHLGFHCEGTMVRYTKDGLDYRMWARTDVR